MITKKQWDRAKGHILEEKIYQKIKRKGIQFNHTNILIKRPEQYNNKQWHEKKHIEIDNMFYHKGKIYIIQCKKRKKYSKGRYNLFKVPTREGQELYLDQRKVTGKYLDNLWKASQYIKYHKLFKFHGKPEIVLILLLDANFNVAAYKASYAYVRNVLILTYDYFDKFLENIHHTQQP